MPKTINRVGCCLKSILMKKYLISIFILPVFLLFLNACSDEDVVSVQDSERGTKVTYVIDDIKYNEILEDIEKDKFVNDEVESMLVNSKNLMIHINENEPDTYYLFDNYNKWIALSQSSISDDNARRTVCEYNQVKIWLYDSKNYSSRPIDFFYHNNSDRYEILLNRVFDEDTADDYVNFSYKTSSLKVVRSVRGGDCGIWYFNFIDTRVNDSNVSLNNRRNLQLSMGPGEPGPNSGPNNGEGRYELPDLSVLRFDNKCDRITIDFREPGDPLWWPW